MLNIQDKLSQVHFFFNFMFSGKKSIHEEKFPQDGNCLTV